MRSILPGLLFALGCVLLPAACSDDAGGQRNNGTSDIGPADPSDTGPSDAEDAGGGGGGGGDTGDGDPDDTGSPEDTGAPDTGTDAEMDAGADTGMDADAGTEPAAGDATALYGLNGARWNDWVVNDGATPLESSGADCTAEMADDRRDACVHAGELRAFELPTMPDCDGVTITDALAAFDWICDDAGGAVRAVSTGLRQGAHLSTLLDLTPGAVGWRMNSITATNGSVTDSTQPTVWWENLVVEDNDGGDLTDAGTIYVVTANPNAIYEIAADEAGLVVAPGVVLQAGATAGSYGMVYSQGQDFNWVEGRLDGAGQRIGASFSGNFVVLDSVVVEGLTGQPGQGIKAGGEAFYGRDLEVRGGAYEGMDLDASHSTWTRLRIEDNAQTGLLSTADQTWFEDVAVTGNGGYSLFLKGNDTLVMRDVVAANNARGINIENCTGGRFERLRALNDDDRNGLDKSLIDIFGGSQCTFKDVVAINGSGKGIRLTGSNHVFANVITANTEYRGVLIEAESNVFLGVSAANTERFGIEVSDPHNTLVNLAAVNNGLPGIYLFGGAGSSIHNAASTNNGVAGSSKDIQFFGTAFHDISGIVKVTDFDTSCLGATAASALDGACTPQNGTTANVVEATVATGFVGRVATDDAVNPSDTDGVASYDAITDWHNFETPFRGYGRYAAGATFPDAALRDGCRSGESCAIWDFALRTADATALRNVVAAPTTGDEVLVHTWRATTATGCASIDGAVWDAALSLCTTTFLHSAVELLFDSIGNDNGLCESNEACAVSTNLGGYQGHGGLAQSTAIGSGNTVENVQLYTYATNGY